jgi:hypothetical protein
MASTVSTDRSDPSGISRRALMGAGVGVVVMGLSPGRAPANAAALPVPDLFVFRAPASNNTVIGVIFAPAHGELERLKSVVTSVRISAGSRNWASDVHRTPRIKESHGVRMFSGKGSFGHGHASHDAVDAVVIEIEGSSFLSQRVEIWAELLLGDSSRLRLGNPVMAELIKRDESLARAYHQGSPATDRSALTAAVMRSVATRAAERGAVSDPEAHARRIAKTILPDVVTYDSALPVGFSFSGQNGRHPADRTSEIVDTMLSGNASRKISIVSFVMPLDRFPYMIIPADIA